MSHYSYKQVFLILIALLLTATTASANWPQNIDSPVPVCTAPNWQGFFSMIDDGQGRMITTWLDLRDGSNDIYVQCLDAAGNTQWATNGVLVVDAFEGVPGEIVLVADGLGGTYVVFPDGHGPWNYEIYAQHIDANGNTTWNNPVDLFPSAEKIWGRRQPCAVSDGAGGVIVGAMDRRSIDNLDIWAQRFDINGNLLWPEAGIPVCLAANNQGSVVGVSDNQGGVIFAWEDERDLATQTQDLYMQHLDAAGSPLWASDGKALCALSGSQVEVCAVPDGAGGAIFSWSDTRNGDYDIYASHVEPVHGNGWWTLSGVRLCDNDENQVSPTLVGDGYGGAFVAWKDSRADGFDSDDIYAQHISNAGALLWGASGYLAAGNNSNQGYYGLDMVSDGHDGVIAVWSGTMGIGGFSSDLIGQRFNSAGYKYWNDNGQLLCRQIGNQKYPQILKHPDGGVAMFFQSDEDLISSNNLFASYIDTHGYPGDVSASITSIVDVPGDQGGSVIVSWAASYRDNVTEGINDYTVWKRLHKASAKSAGSVDPEEFQRALPCGLPEWEIENLILAGWSYVGSIDAAFQEEYAYDAPTYGDTTDEQTLFTDYKVIARESSTVFWESDFAVGSSTDNLAPGAPLNLTAGPVASDVALHWSASQHHDEDLAQYKIYRGTTPDFTPDMGSFLVASTDTSYLDPNPGSGTWYYRVTAQDVHNNEGEPSNLAQAGSLLGVNDGTAPTVMALRGNWPNPFNPSTEIGFDLPQAGRVCLEIFDSSGRRVATLLNDVLPAGNHSEFWYGRDANGRAVASGVYMARLSVGGDVASHRMMLIK